LGAAAAVIASLQLLRVTPSQCTDDMPRDRIIIVAAATERATADDLAAATDAVWIFPSSIFIFG